MDGFNVGKILAGLMNPELYLRKIKQDGVNQGESSFNSAFSQGKQNIVQPNPLNSMILNNQLQMNQLANIDRSIYVKNLLGLPQTLGALLMKAQTNTALPSNTALQPNTTLQPNTLLINDLNEDVIKNQKVLAQIFNENDEILTDKLQAQILQNTAQNITQKDAAALIFSGMINMSAVSEMITKNSKQAVTGLIIAMASASKHGMTNEQIRETLSIINSCVTMAESGNPAQTLKSLMLLYLPWLPLNEGVGFDLEVETADGENESNASRLTVLIQTKNYGNVKGVFTLTTSNSVDILITCSETFPKTLLQRQLKEEGDTHSMSMTIDVEAIQPKIEEHFDKPETKVNLSATNEMNPYLLLIAHAFIRFTVYIDSNAIIDNPTNVT